jgi:CoA:oxalate CoA-transferase
VPRPLEDIVVLDLSRVLAGPYCSMVLADLGADVIKVELPGTGDDARAFGPFVGGESTYYMSLNRNKKSLTLNLKHPKGKAILLKLAARADVVLENFRPGTMERLGLGYEVLKAVNPRVIYAAVSGFGQNGPYADKPCYDIVAQAMGGVMSITGHPGGPPTRVGASIGDITGGFFTIAGILAALHYRDQTGLGQAIDVALLDCQVAILENAVARYALSGKLPGRLGNRHPSVSPFDSMQTSDGDVILAVGNDSIWLRFCRLVGRPELAADERFLTNDDRVLNWPELEPVLAEIFRQRTTDEWVQTLEAAGIPCGPINTIDRVVHDPQVNARRMIVGTDHPKAGRVTMAGCPIKLSEAPDAPPKPAPMLGEHNREILGEYLGLSEREIRALASEGVI